MNGRVRYQRERWNLKAAAFISSALHLFLLVAAAALFSGAAADQASVRIVRVALYPLEDETRVIPQPQPQPSPPATSRFRKLEVNLPSPRPEDRDLLKVHPEPRLLTPPLKAELRAVERVKEPVQEQKKTEPLFQKDVAVPIPLPVQATEREIVAEEPAVVPPPPPREEKPLTESLRPIVVAALDPLPLSNKEEPQPVSPLPSLSGGILEKKDSQAAGKEGDGTRQGGSSSGGHSGHGPGTGIGGGQWKGFGEGLGRVGSLGGGTGSGAGTGAGSGSGQGDGYKGASGKEKGLLAKLFSPASGGSVGPHPRYTNNPKPPYPREARDRGYQGEVLLRVEVLSSGKVGQIEIRRSSGYEVLDQSALSTVKQWRFVPGQREQEPVPLWVNIPIRFQLE